MIRNTPESRLVRGAAAARQLGDGAIGKAYPDTQDAAFYKALSMLSIDSPLDRFFSRLHAMLANFVDAPILIAAAKNGASADGFRARYQRNLEESDVLAAVDATSIAAAMLARRALLFGSRKAPTGTSLRSLPAGSGSLIVAPMLVAGRAIGYLAAKHPSDAVFGHRDIARIAAAAGVAALVVHAEIAQDEAESRAREVRFMLETARVLSSERDMLQLFARFHDLIDGVMDAETFWIALGSWERSEMQIPYCIHRRRRIMVEGPVPITGSISGHVFRDGSPVIVRSPKDWLACPVVEQGERADVRSALVVPMRIGIQTIGAISVQSSKVDAYSERDRDLMMAIAEQAAIAVENSEAIDCAERRAKELTLLSEVTRSLTSQLSLGPLCKTVSDHVRGTMDAAIFFIAVADPEGRTVSLRCCVEDGSITSFGDHRPVDGTMMERVLQSGEPLVLHGAGVIESIPHVNLPPGPDQRPMQALAMIPLRLGSSCLGVMCAQSREPGAYTESNVRLLASIADHVGLAIQNTQLFSDALNRAERDPLTNLFHHRYLKSRLEHEISAAGGNHVAVLMADLDNFKLVNDTYGHPVGDDALRLMTSVLQSTCRSTDIVGRYGGDEFMAILPNADRATAMHIADRISSELSTRFLQCGDVRIPIRASLGVAVYPKDGSSASDLVAKADAALYHSKRQGHPVGRMQKIGSGTMRLIGDFSAVAELLSAVLARDPATREHLEHVNRVAYDFGAQLGLDDESSHALLLASVLHDVGKIAVPIAILRKPGKLTEFEYELVQRHPFIGASLIEYIPGYAKAAEAVLHHHEAFDGSGYPGGLAGDQIPLIARVVTLIDVYSALIVDRPYHKGMAPAAAIAELRRCSGTQFDPALVERFTDLLVRMDAPPRAGRRRGGVC